MRRLLFAFLFGVAAYFVFAFVGYFLILWLSPNRYDRSVEAAMTAAFAIGPFGTLCGIVAGAIFGGRRRASAPPPTS